MTDDTFPQPAGDSEALSAYLAGEMSDADARAFEQRLDVEPALAARLDALAAALVSLGGFDAVDVPEGFDQRLDARLAAEHPPASAAQTAPVDLATHRDKRDRSRLWLGLGTAAAVVAVGAVMAGSVLGGLGGGDAMTARDSAESGAAALRGSSESAAFGESAPGGPLILDQQVALADEAALERRYGDAPEAQGLIGLPVEEARRLESRFTKTVQQRSKVLSDTAVGAPEMSASAGSAAGGAAGGAAEAPAEQERAAERAPAKDESGAEAPEATTQDDVALAPKPVRRADPCLAAIRQDAKAPLVPVRVESVRYAGRRAIAYIFVTAAPDAPELDRTEVWVVRRDNCATLVFQQY